jgi:hypothetical protein
VVTWSDINPRALARKENHLLTVRLVRARNPSLGRTEIASPREGSQRKLDASLPASWLAASHRPNQQVSGVNLFPDNRAANRVVACKAACRRASHFIRKAKNDFSWLVRRASQHLMCPTYLFQGNHGAHTRG